MADEQKDPHAVAPTIVEKIAASCSSGSCPTIYRTDRGTLIVQGHMIEPGSVGISVSDGEKLVEIPLPLLLSVTDNVA
ncbi:hypothetical protein [Actinoplanes sp. NPDC089786]|uniref:hypothetical protein n=1 Tax=Actinoplanes sp. NPDC089786 TaxID=3155185 RepID=UPI003420C45A